MGDVIWTPTNTTRVNNKQTECSKKCKPKTTLVITTAHLNMMMMACGCQRNIHWLILSLCHFIVKEHANALGYCSRRPTDFRLQSRKCQLTKAMWNEGTGIDSAQINKFVGRQTARQEVREGKWHKVAQQLKTVSPMLTATEFLLFSCSKFICFAAVVAQLFIGFWLCCLFHFLPLCCLEVENQAKMSLELICYELWPKVHAPMHKTHIKWSHK